MDAEELVGQRLVDLRKQAGLRQSDFLERLQQRGVSWTQGVLSRVEGGKRPMRLTEALAVADALNVQLGELAVPNDSLKHRIKVLRGRLKTQEEIHSGSRRKMESLQQQIAALSALSQLRSAADDFVLSGGAAELIEVLAEALQPDDFRSQRIQSREEAEADALTWLAIDPRNVFVAIDPAPGDKEAHYRKVLLERYPRLRVVDGDRLSVEGADPDVR